MKTFRSISIKAALATAVCLLAYGQSRAQILEDAYFHIDWQLNTPLGSTPFADKTTGWGMNFDGGYYIAPRWALGGFISYHTNNEHIARATFPVNGESAVTTDQIHSVFQLPFGVSGLYRFSEGRVLEPYVALKMGANYARISSDFYILEAYKKTWGFYLSPEVGLNIFPSYAHRIGFHVAAYYSYASNSTHLMRYTLSNLNNFGIRVGITF